MSRYKGNDEECPKCGISYKAFKTGFAYRDVWIMLSDYSPDSAEWRYKRRGTILGKLFEMKQEFWKQHLEECGREPEGEAPF